MAILIGSRIRFIIYCLLNIALFLGLFYTFIQTRNPLLMSVSLYALCEVMFATSRIFTFEFGQIGSVQRYGIGKMRLQYVFQIVFSTVATFIGFYILAQGIKDLNMEFEPIQFHLLTAIVLGLHFLHHIYFFLSGWNRLKKDKSPLDFDTYLKHSGDPQLFQFLLNLLFNSFTSFLAIFAMTLSFLAQTSFLEILAMLFIGASLAVFSVYTIVTNYRFIIGNPLSSQEITKIKDHLNSIETVESVDQIMSEVLGPAKIRVCLQLKFKEMKVGNNFRLRRYIHNKIYYPERVKDLSEDEKLEVEKYSKKIISIEQDLRLKFRQLAIIDIEAS